MNIVHQMIARRRQEFEGRIQRTAVNPVRSTFRQELANANNSTNTSAEEVANNLPTVEDNPTLAHTNTLNVDTLVVNVFTSQLVQLDGNQNPIQPPQVDGNASSRITTPPPQVEGNANIDVSTPSSQEVESANSQPISGGRDRWNIMERYNITPIRAANATKHMDIISEMSEKHGVPIELIQRVIEVESNFRNDARSPAGAQGLMQLMPATARSLGVTNPFDPGQNIEAGTRYLSQHLNRFNGDVVLALAAYNAGMGNVNRHNGVPPFRETINYIRKITGIDVAGA